MLLRERVGAVPGLAVIQVGNHKVSDLYARSKQLGCEEVGIESFAAYLPASASEDEVLELVNVLNADKRVHGILVQLPMPPVSPSLVILLLFCTCHVLRLFINS
jgi:methylenetetrahydrofolate dehydrogenase (NADP+)/methenyltetrahydrofolate cyclohydrolase